MDAARPDGPPTLRWQANFHRTGVPSDPASPNKAPSPLPQNRKRAVCAQITAFGQINGVNITSFGWFDQDQCFLRRGAQEWRKVEQGG
jgi:hypothetical protein